MLKEIGVCSVSIHPNLNIPAFQCAVSGGPKHAFQHSRIAHFVATTNHSSLLSGKCQSVCTNMTFLCNMVLFAFNVFEIIPFLRCMETLKYIFYFVPWKHIEIICLPLLWGDIFETLSLPFCMQTLYNINSSLFHGYAFKTILFLYFHPMISYFGFMNIQ